MKQEKVKVLLSIAEILTFTLNSENVNKDTCESKKIQDFVKVPVHCNLL